MPTAYRIDPEAEIVWSRAWGVLTECDTAAHYRRLSAEPAFRPTFRHFVDLRAVVRMDLSPSAIRDVAKAGLFAPGARRAFLAPKDIHYGLSRMLQSFVEIEGSEIGVFRSAAEVAAWLGIPEETIDTPGLGEPGSTTSD
ncbi:MAG: hypothetical protein IT181_01285 [Acidobacteria bacterium]|nr:hypothetical protein [Acidobacteriota bacterium]